MFRIITHVVWPGYNLIAYNVTSDSILV